MIHLEHINLAVKDIPEMLTFYQAAFPHWKVRDQGQSEWHGKVCNWLHFGDDYQYIAMNDYGEGENRKLNGHNIGLAHFAFITNNLNATINRLSQAGFEVDKEGADEPFRKNCYFIDPTGFEVEFVEYMSDLPAQRNATS
jgi:catechol-2,3-dioxygenase